MIVRRERGKLKRRLGSLPPHLSCRVIAGTGSTDGAPEPIAGFSAGRSIPGEPHQIPYETFGQAGNAGLDRAAASPCPATPCASPMPTWTSWPRTQA
jgi:hypothetical protein